MNARLHRGIAAGIAAAAITLSAAGSQPGKSSSDSSTDPPEIHIGRDALRHIVQDRCVVHWSREHNPAPCERVFLPDSKTKNSGYAVLADRKGGAHYLLVPTQTLAGIESSELLDPHAPNYFAEAWHARDLLTGFVGHAVPRTAVGLAVNNAHARTQGQFHIHIECLRQDVSESLQAAAEHIEDAWSPLRIAGAPYHAIRVMGEGLDASNPLELLARLTPNVIHHMGDYTVVVAGMEFRSGPGFIVLTGTGPTGELLLDARCAVAGGGETSKIAFFSRRD